MAWELKLFSTQIDTWASPLLIRAFDEKDAEGLARMLFKVPTDGTITATAVREELGQVEHLVANQKVGGSNPPSRSKEI